MSKITLGRPVKKVNIKIRHPGALEGYKINQSAGTRREHLLDATSISGYKKTMMRLNALAVFNINHPSKHRIVASDMQWLHNLYSERIGFKGRQSTRGYS